MGGPANCLLKISKIQCNTVHMRDVLSVSLLIMIGGPPKVTVYTKQGRIRGGGGVSCGSGPPSSPSFWGPPNFIKRGGKNVARMRANTPYFGSFNSYPDRITLPHFRNRVSAPAERVSLCYSYMQHILSEAKIDMQLGLKVRNSTL